MTEAPISKIYTLIRYILLLFYGKFIATIFLYGHNIMLYYVINDYYIKRVNM